MMPESLSAVTVALFAVTADPLRIDASVTDSIVLTLTWPATLYPWADRAPAPLAEIERIWASPLASTVRSPLRSRLASSTRARVPPEMLLWLYAPARATEVPELFVTREAAPLTALMSESLAAVTDADAASTDARRTCARAVSSRAFTDTLAEIPIPYWPPCSSDPASVVCVGIRCAPMTGLTLWACSGSGSVSFLITAAASD